MAAGTAIRLITLQCQGFSHNQEEDKSHADGGLQKLYDSSGLCH